MKEISKIHQMMKVMMPFDVRKANHFKFVNISTGNYNPPAYMIQMLLMGIFRFKNYGTMDKAFWHTYLQYKNQPFMIRDYKFSGWTIEGTSVDKEMVELADELRNKIIKASKMLDRALYADLKTRLEKGSFYLNNVYHNLSSVFDFYEEKIFSTIKNVKFERGIKKRENNSRS